MTLPKTNKIKKQPNNLVLTETHDFQRLAGKGQHRTTKVTVATETATSTSVGASTSFGKQGVALRSCN